MKQLNITFDEKDYRKVRKARELTNAASWREWILLLIEQSRRENEKSS